MPITFADNTALPSVEELRESDSYKQATPEERALVETHYLKFVNDAAQRNIPDWTPENTQKIAAEMRPGRTEVASQAVRQVAADQLPNVLGSIKQGIPQHQQAHAWNNSDLQGVADAAAKMQSLPSDTFREGESAWDAIKARPFKTVGEVAVQSLVSQAPELAMASLAGRAAPLAIGVAGYWNEHGNTMLEEVSKISKRDGSPIDLTNTMDLEAVLSDPYYKGRLEEARKKGQIRGATIGFIDVFTAGILSKLGGSAAAKGLTGAKETLKRGAVNTLAEATSGGVGEGVAQVLSGDDIDTGEMALEFLAEGPTSLSGMAADSLTAKRKAKREAQRKSEPPPLPEAGPSSQEGNQQQQQQEDPQQPRGRRVHVVTPQEQMKALGEMAYQAGKIERGEGQKQLPYSNIDVNEQPRGNALPDQMRTSEVLDDELIRSREARKQRELEHSIDTPAKEESRQVEGIRQLEAGPRQLEAGQRQIGSNPQLTGNQRQIEDRKQQDPEPVAQQDTEPEVDQAPERAPEGSVQHEIGDVVPEYLPVPKLKLSKDVPQFKSGADEKGITRPLQGKYRKYGVAPITVWQRNNGDLEVISGRHRLDLAQRNGNKTILSQVLKESEGFTAQKAMIADAEINILDGQGKVKDYANYFKHSGLDEQEAITRGLLADFKGHSGWTIGTKGSEEVFALHANGKLTDRAAAAIADTAPGDSALQRVGADQILKGLPIDVAVTLMRDIAYRNKNGSQTGSQLDLFGNDDSAMNEMIALAKRVTEIQRDIRSKISAVRGASKNPGKAASMGVDVKDPVGLKNKIKALENDLARWKEWQKHDDLRATLRGEEPAAKSQGDVQASQASQNNDDGPGLFASPAEHKDSANADPDNFINPWVGYEPLKNKRLHAASKLRSIVHDYLKSKTEIDTFVDDVISLSQRMRDVVKTKREKRGSNVRARGADIIRERLIRGRRQGDLDSDAVDFALWFIDKNPNIAEGLGISITKGSENTDAAGLYNPAYRLMKLFKGRTNDGTAVHEILHHTERMMPDDIRAGITKEWARAYAKALKSADAKTQEALALFPDAMAGNQKAQKAIMKAFDNGTLNRDDHYQLTNPSEFWTENATRILAKRNAAGSWVSKARNWISEMIQKAKGLFGLKSDSAVLKGLKEVLKTDGEFKSRKMFAEGTKTFAQMNHGGAYSNVGDGGKTPKVKKDLAKVAGDLAGGMNSLLTPISDVLRKIDVSLSRGLRKMWYRSIRNTTLDVRQVRPFMDGLAAIRKASKVDYQVMKMALLNGDHTKALDIAKHYDLENAYIAVRSVIARIEKDAKDVGLEFASLANYWPRVVHDVPEFSQWLKGSGQFSLIERAIRAHEREKDKSIARAQIKAKEDRLTQNAIDAAVHAGEVALGRKLLKKEIAAIKKKTPRQKMSAQDKQNFLNSRQPYKMSLPEKDALAASLIRGYGEDKLGLGTDNTKERLIKQLTPDMLNFYEDPAVSLIQHIKRMNETVSARKYFGLDANTPKLTTTDDAIGSLVRKLVANGKMTWQQEQRVIDIHRAFFKNTGPTNSIIRMYRSFEYMDTMGTFLMSAISQMDDIFVAAYEAGIINTAVGFGKASAESVKRGGAILKNRKRGTRVNVPGFVGMEDVGLSEMAHELINDAGPSRGNSLDKFLSKALARVFDVTLLRAFDAVGKETLINAKYRQLQQEAKKGKFGQKSERLLNDAFTDADRARVVNALKQGFLTDDVRLLLFHEVSNVQPIGPVEVPQKYLEMTNGKIFYMLKTFMIRRLGFIRKEVTDTRIPVKTRMKNFVWISALLMGGGMTIDEIKDLILGRETELDDRVIDNLVKLTGLNKFFAYEVREKGPGTAIAKLVAPPFKAIDAATRDINRKIKGQESKLEITSSIPIIGRLYYWRFGRGAERQAKKELERAMEPERNWLGNPSDGEFGPVNRPSKRFQVDNETHTMTPEQYQDFVRLAGDYTREALELEKIGMDEITDDHRKIISEARLEAKMELFPELYPSSKSTRSSRSSRRSRSSRSRRTRRSRRDR